ncbi:testis-specific serine/threonine-protein kinase 3-like [Agrilus planipennis]|uniref:Testis-specific serine/threonine-protein kinase 3-like n=1 Tax=Agrilus planipennis TaxID=224129 RepID=A0A7F5RMV3_AGRPL|nr:testis-specific serine/threonine-protein kinase 3-like [Agrilus planipennis]
MTDTNKSSRKKSSKSQSADTNKILKFMGYSIGKIIGVGTYSKVCLAQFTSKEKSEKMACKKINKIIAGEDFMKKFLPREISILQKIDHPHIIKVHNVFEIKEVIFIFMDYCEHGDMLEYIRKHGPLSEEKAKFYFRQLISAVEYLHSLHIAHRDLKCENVLLFTKKHIKLADFGFARYCDSQNGTDMSKTFCGSAAYAAPEILQGIPYDPKMYDIWALGCILYVLVTASMPFDDSDIKKMIKTQINCDILLVGFSLWKNNSSQLRILLGRLLQPEVEKRATINEVVRSSWLKQKKSSSSSEDEYLDIINN